MISKATSDSVPVNGSFTTIAVRQMHSIGSSFQTPGILKSALLKSCLTTLLALAALLSGACTESRVGKPDETPVVTVPPNTTYPMPPLSGKSLNNMGWDLANGKRALFSDYRGKVLVLDFYATWCMPCRESVPHLVELQQRYQNQGLEVVGLNVGGPDDLERVADFAREFRIQYGLGTPDEDLSGFLLSDNSDIPQTFVFDRQGQLRRRFVGYGPAAGDQIDDVVEKAIQASAQ